MEKLNQWRERNRKKQEIQRKNHRENAQNGGGQRGGAEVDTEFMDILEEEEDLCRELGLL